VAAEGDDHGLLLALSTEDCGCLGPIVTSSVVWRLRHFWTVVGLTPWRRASALTLASLSYGRTWVMAD